MSLSELERLLGEAQAAASLRQPLRRCGSERHQNQHCTETSAAASRGLG